MRALLLCALVACTYPEKQLAPDFLCAGQQPGMTADRQITVAGVTLLVPMQSPVKSAQIEVTLTGSSLVTGSATSDANGAFTITVTTGDLPYDAYLHVTSNGNLITDAYPAAPALHSFGAVIEVFDGATLDALVGAAGVTPDPSKGNVLVVAEDCDGFPVANANVTSDAGGIPLFFTGSAFVSVPGGLTNSSGVVLLANVNTGPVNISATVGSVSLRKRPLTVASGQIIQTALQP